MEDQIEKKRAGISDLFLNGIENFFVLVASFSLFVMMIVSSLDALGRYILNMPIPGVLEITEEYFMIAIIFLPLSYVYFRGGQIRIEMIEQHFPPRLRYYLEKFNYVVSFILFFLIMIASSRIFLQAIEINEISSSSLGYPLAASFAMVPLGSAFLCIRAMQMLFGKKPVRDPEHV